MPLVGDGLEHMVADITQRRDRILLGELGQAGQVQNLRDLAAADDTDS